MSGSGTGSNRSEAGAHEGTMRMFRKAKENGYKELPDTVQGLLRLSDECPPELAQRIRTKAAKVLDR